MGEVLRFSPIAFSRTTSGAGKFKVCFCDSALLTGEKCLSETDYSLEVGDLYVSGVSCLLADPKYRRGPATRCTTAAWVLGDAHAAVNHEVACVGRIAYVVVGIREHVMRDQQLHIW